MRLRFPAPLLAVLGFVALAPSAAAAAPLYKCKNASGQIVYSDTDCRTDLPKVTIRPPEPKKEAPAPAMPAAPAAPVARVDRLTTAVVESVLQRTRENSDRGDFASDCALAAPDLSFTMIDRSKSPEIKSSGGRDEICKLQRDSANAMRAAGLGSQSTITQLQIQINADGTQATAKYLMNTRILANGSSVMGMRCENDDTLALYDGKALFKRAWATCTPVR